MFCAWKDLEVSFCSPKNDIYPTSAPEVTSSPAPTAYCDKSSITAYNETFAQDVGRAVRDNIMSPEHKLVFPDHELKEGSAAAQRLETGQGGMLAFVGRGGSITGRGGHGIVIDDPIKDRQEADSNHITAAGEALGE